MSVRLQTNIAYGQGPRHRYDLYTPGSGPTDTLIVFFYGGSWRRGSKQTYKFVGRALARMGYTVVIPDYRVYPAVKFPGFIEDGAAALQHAAAQYKPRRLVVMGHSAGGHIAATLALDAARYAKGLPEPAAHIAGFIGLAGAYNPKVWKRNVVFGDAPPARWNPQDLVTATAPPMLLLHGRQDTTVRPRQSIELAATVEAAGGRAEVHLYRPMEHFAALLPFVPGFRFYTAMRRDIRRFIASLD